MKVLHLTLKKKWFDMIASGEKKEEYRDIGHFWRVRLCDRYPLKDGGMATVFKSFDAVCFINGYRPDSPRITMKFEGIGKNIGRAEWGADPGVTYFVIKLGEKIF